MIPEAASAPQPILFVELRFVWIFALIFLVHWSLRSNAARKLWLLVCSHVFYGCFFVGDPIEFGTNLFAGRLDRLPTGWWFPSLLWLSTVMDYSVGLGIERARTASARKRWISTSLIVNLGVLGFFKYFGFFEQNVRAVVAWLGLTPSWEPLYVFLPYGISFYTFQSLSYSIDVYRGRLRAERSFLDLALFIAFFPQVVAGPIVRASTFLPQTATRVAWAKVDLRGCLVLFLVGFFKKACVADTLARVSDLYFAAPEHYDAFSAWAATLCYAGQIYCDFSGYTDMAIAVAGLLGYELCLNFDFPYLSRSVAEFWHRWHISLSSWLRDYLYIPLGGNRGSRLFTARNLMLTMLLGGLWHGAAWTFVAWGGMHGLALVVHRAWARRTADRPAIRRVMARLGLPLTLLWVLLAWVPFRANDVYIDRMEPSDRGARRLHRTSAGFEDATDHALVYPYEDTSAPGLAANPDTPPVALDPATGLWHGTAEDGSDVTIRLHQSGFAVTGTVWQAMSWLGREGSERVCRDAIALVLALLAFVHALNARGVFRTVWQRLPDPAFYALLGVGWGIAVTLVAVGYTPFIYFQF
ncbi:MAG: MBOAT family O-acyltransferase [Myxococcota bacterium]